MSYSTSSILKITTVCFQLLMFCACSNQGKDPKTEKSAQNGVLTEADSIAKLPDAFLDTVKLNISDSEHKKIVIGELKYLKFILESKSTKKLNKYLKYWEKKNKSGSNWSIYRDLIHGTREGVYYFTFLLPEKENKKISIVYTFPFHVLMNQNEIISYELIEKRGYFKDHKPATYAYSILGYRNEAAFNSLQHNFQSIYGIEMSEKELFQDYKSFGTDCTMNEHSSAQFAETATFIRQKNRKKLYALLQSTNTETQFFGVYGFYELHKSGMELNEEEHRLIHVILNKNGTMSTCERNGKRREEIQIVRTKYDF